MSRILVIGGSGFIGREICRLAAAEGHDVRSVSRSGQPDTAEPWIADVEWIEADVFEPTSWQGALDACDAVVHTVGMISMIPRRGPARERMDGDSAIIAGLAAERAGVPSFVLLSVEGAVAAAAHIAAKRRAERTLSELRPRTTSLRLSPVYSTAGGGGSYPRLLNRALRAIGEHEWLARLLGGSRPLSLTTVALVALHAALDPDTPSMMDLEMIVASSLR